MGKARTLIRATLVVAAATPFVFVQQTSAATWLPTYNYKTLNGTYLVSRIITPDGTDTPYTFKERVNNVKVTAPSSNTGGNLREFFWPANSPEVVDGMTCAKWSYQSVDVQQGATLRIKETATSLRGITVTKGYIFGASQAFNVHLWDTDNPGFNQIAQFDMGDVTGRLWVDEQGVHNTIKPLPWHLCARTIGNKLQFKVWTSEQLTQPSWNDTIYTREVTLPDEWVYAGKTGWYIGHVAPGQVAEFQNLQTWQRL